jgi:hypothetical protein
MFGTIAWLVHTAPPQGKDDAARTTLQDEAPAHLGADQHLLHTAVRHDERHGEASDSGLGEAH